MTNGPLHDIKVLETGTLIAGPFCGQLLGDMGAEVIKVEAPGRGDPMRGWGRVKPGGRSLWWPVIGRNKKSITLDLRTEDGQAILRDLAREADILIENFRPGTYERWGLGYDVLKELNPGLIFVRVSGYGQTGPYAGRASYGSIGEAMGGLRYVTGDPSTATSRVGVSIGDGLAATHAVIGALSALHHRDRTGEGQVIDSALYESVLAMMESLVTEYDQAQFIRERSGPILPGIAPSNVYPTADDQSLLVAGNNDTVFRRLAEAMGQPELADDPRYMTHEARGEHQAELDEIVGAWTQTQTLAALESLLADKGVPASRIYRPPDMLSDPHFKAREAITVVEHPEWGELAMQNVVPRLSETPASIRTPAPTLGQHNDEVFRRRLGLDDARIAELESKGVI